MSNSRFKRYLIPVWWNEYTADSFKGDLTAGFTLGVMLIPQGMAYAMLAGMPAIYGLYATLLPSFFYAWLGSSRRLAIGPAAGTCILMNSAVSNVAESNTPEYIQTAAMLAILCGLIYIVMLILRLSKLVRYLTPPITKGFIASAGIIIFANQLKHLLGLDIRRTQDITIIAQDLMEQLPSINWITFAIGIVGILFLYFIPKWKKTFPTALLIIILSILVVAQMGFDTQGVSIMKDVPDGLPSLVNLSWDFDTILALLPSAAIITMVGFTVSISIAQIVAERNGVNDVRPRRELLAIGLANISSGIFGGVVVNGSLTRTMVNEQAGAKSGLSLVISAILILLTLLFLTPLFYYLPKTILAAVIIVAVIKLIKPSDAISFYKTSKADFAVYMVTFISVLVFGLEMGIIIGLVFSLFVTGYQNYRK